MAQPRYRQDMVHGARPGVSRFAHLKAASQQPGHSPASQGAAVSSWDGTSHRVDLKGHDEEYGTPEAGSKTDKRGRHAGALITGEVVELCRYIHDLGMRVPNTFVWAVSFGTLFDFYTKISNKLVGMLMRARKHGLVQFEGEMLFQRRDDDVIIYLVQIPGDLREYVEMKNGISLG